MTNSIKSKVTDKVKPRCFGFNAEKLVQRVLNRMIENPSEIAIFESKSTAFFSEKNRYTVSLINQMLDTPKADKDEIKRLIMKSAEEKYYECEWLPLAHKTDELTAILYNTEVSEKINTELLDKAVKEIRIEADGVAVVFINGATIFERKDKNEHGRSKTRDDNSRKAN